MSQFKPNEARAKQAKNVILVSLILAVVFLIQILIYYIPLIFDSTTSELRLWEAIVNEPTIPILEKLQNIASLGGVIYVILWFRRAYFNLHLRVTNLSYNESAAAWTWFVPIMNLYAPYQIMTEIVTNSQNALSAKDSTFNTPISQTSVKIWWLSHIAVYIFLLFILSTIYLEIDYSPVFYILMMIMAHSSTIISAIFLIRIISSYAIIEEQLNDGKSEIDEIGKID